MSRLLISITISDNKLRNTFSFVKSKILRALGNIKFHSNIYQFEDTMVEWIYSYTYIHKKLEVITRRLLADFFKPLSRNDEGAVLKNVRQMTMILIKVNELQIQSTAWDDDFTNCTIQYSCHIKVKSLILVSVKMRSFYQRDPHLNLCKGHQNLWLNEVIYLSICLV